MSNEISEESRMVITLDDYKFQLKDVNEPGGFAEYKGKMEVSYDGEFLGIDVWETPIDHDFADSPVQQITLVGPDQSNLLVGAVLALLESYGHQTVLDDEDIQAEYKQMADEAKIIYAQEAENSSTQETTEQSED
jgi:hypothetical protein